MVNKPTISKTYGVDANRLLQRFPSAFRMGRSKLSPLRVPVGQQTQPCHIVCRLHQVVGFSKPKQDSIGLEKGWAPRRVKHLPVFIQGRCLCTWGAGDAWSAGVNGWPIPATALGGWVHGVVSGRTVLPASNLLWAPVALSCVSRCVRIPAGPELQS